MLLLVMDVGFENSSIGSGKGNVSRVIPRLYRWVYKTLNFETLLRTLTLAVRVQLPLGWNIYLFYNSDIVNFPS